MEILNLLWNATQQVEIHRAKQSVVDSKHEAQSTARKEVGDAYLEHSNRLDKLSLICEAMWSLVQERTGLTERDLLERVTELDLKDGVLDGKYTKPAVDCPKCSSKMCRKFNRCLFCGEEYTEGSPFDTV